MGEVKFDFKEHLLKTVVAPMTTLFRVADNSSGVLREVAYSIRNECLKLYEEGLAKPGENLRDIDRFIETFRKSGLPKGIRDDRELMIRVLGKGFDTFLDVAEYGSPLLQQVEYSWRFAEMGYFPEPSPMLIHQPLPCCWSVLAGDAITKLTEQVKSQVMSCYGGSEHPVPHIQPQPRQGIEMHCDTVFWSVEAPDGGCGLPLVREGIIKQSVRSCAILGITIPKHQIELLVGHPVEIELVDSPAVREGAPSCDIRVHLSPSVVRISSRPCLLPFGW